MKYGFIREVILPGAPSLARTLILALGVAIGISVNAVADTATPQASPPASSPYQITPHLHGAPLPSGPNNPSEKDFRKLYTAWLNRTIMTHFPADKDPAGAAFMRATLDYLGSSPSSRPPPDLVAQESPFQLAAVNDPALLFLIGFVEGSSARQRDAFHKALALVPASAYPKFIWFTVAANVGSMDKQTHADVDQLQKDDELSLKYLDAGLHDDSFLPNEMAALRWRFNAGSFMDLFSRNQQRVADIFESSPSVDPWVRNYVEGFKFVKAAWQARGSDTADKVTSGGWQGFAQDLAFARSRLESSWDENPHDPAAAAEMIAVCMGDNEETDTMRAWFDRSVAADFDYPIAYSNMRWGLRPRWLGSYQEMNAFGQECAATGRYDTLVPYERVTAAMDNAEDQDDHGAEFQNPEIASQVLTVLDKYFAQPKVIIPVAFAHTLAAIVARKSGNIDEMKRHLAAINYKPVSTIFLMKLDDLPAMVNQAQAAGAP